MIDYENSTNIWRYKDKRHYIYEMIDYITNVSTNFWTRLENGEPELVDDLNPEHNKASGPKSLASKICKYFSDIFLGKDNYYINDNVVRHVLPYYLNHYTLLKSNLTRGYFDSLGYKGLFDCLESLRKTTGEILNRDEIDRIMWYCYRYE